MTKNFDWNYCPAVDVSASMIETVVSTLDSNKPLYTLSKPLKEQYEKMVVDAQAKSLEKLLSVINRNALK